MSYNKEDYEFKIERNYSEEEWEVIRKQFQNVLPSIMIDSDMTTADIKFTIAKISSLLPTALMINSYIKTDFENIENKHKSLLKSLTYDAKMASAKAAGMKTYTDSEATGKAHKVLREGKMKKIKTDENKKGYKMVRVDNGPTVEQLREMYTERYNFMYSVVESLRTKKDLLVTYGSMLKMESAI
ncbi:MAG: hypothetical protein B6I28_00400 [Fusobacteriia bacterium 4572_132]|nr:MAG: hypothetical protein B6I28_00400 [Fusobacteriia bacterium 4572_132]